MNWQLYYYIAPICLLAIVLVFAIARNYAVLTTPSQNRRPVEIELLSAAICVGFFAIYFNFLRGTSSFAYSDIGADTIDQYVPYYLDLIRKVKNGTLGLWNMNYGLGTSFMSYQSWTLDPFCLVVVPLTILLGEESLSQVLVIAQGLKMLFCGLMLDHILTFYCRLPISRLVGSLLYSFCGFLLLWGQHYWLGATMVMATLMMLMLELMMSRWSMPRFFGLAAASAGSIIMSTYSGFAVMLFSVAYALLRIPMACDTKGAKEYLRRFVLLAIPAACGVLISCVTLVPYAVAMIQESSRIVSDGQDPLVQRMAGYAGGFVPLRWVPYLLSRLLGNGLVAVSADLPASTVPTASFFTQVNVYEMPQMGFSMISIILLCQFAWIEAHNNDRREKCLALLATLLCLLYCVNAFLPALSNVFSTVRYRASFALAAPVCIAMTVAWERCVMEAKPSPKVLIASIAATAAILLWSYKNTSDGRLICLYYGLVMLALLPLFGTLLRGKAGKYTYVLIAVLAISTSVVDGFFVTNSRAWIARENFPLATSSYDQDTFAALDYISSQETEGSAHRVEKMYGDLNSSLTQGFMGIDSYNSTINSNLEVFYQKLWPTAIRRISAYQAARDDINHPVILRMLGVRYVLSNHDVIIDGYELASTFGDVRVYKSQETVGLATLYYDAVEESSVDNATPGELEALLRQTAIISTDAPQAFPNPAEGYQNETSAPLPVDVQLISQTQIAFSTSSQERTVCAVAIPYAEGWSATIDGQEASTFRANYGFLGIVLEPGIHEIALSYQPRGLRAGLVLAFAGVVLACATSLATRKLNSTTKS